MAAYGTTRPWRGFSLLVFGLASFDAGSAHS